jgi:hypothetical protein
MCLESTELHHVQDVLRKDPIIRMLLLGPNHEDEESNCQNNNEPLDISSIPLYRWRHIRDYSLRIDDGRDGYPCMCIAFDDHTNTDIETIQSLRSDTQSEYLETMIRSERVIAAGPLHVPYRKMIHYRYRLVILFYSMPRIVMMRYNFVKIYQPQSMDCMIVCGYIFIIPWMFLGNLYQKIHYGMHHVNK